MDTVSSLSPEPRSGPSWGPLSSFYIMAWVPYFPHVCPHFQKQTGMRDPQEFSLFSGSHRQWPVATYTGDSCGSLTKLSAEAPMRAKSGALVAWQWGSGSCPGERAELCLYAQQLYCITGCEYLTLSLSGEADQHFVSAYFIGFLGAQWLKYRVWKCHWYCWSYNCHYRIHVLATGLTATWWAYDAPQTHWGWWLQCALDWNSDFICVSEGPLDYLSCFLWSCLGFKVMGPKWNGFCGTWS